jgi:hypothetical protein
MATNEHFNVEEGTKGNGPFMALIEMGLMKTTTSNVKVCGALKYILDVQVWTFPIVHVLGKSTRA